MKAGSEGGARVSASKGATGWAGERGRGVQSLFAFRSNRSPVRPTRDEAFTAPTGMVAGRQYSFGISHQRRLHRTGFAGVLPAIRAGALREKVLPWQEKLLFKVPR